MVALTPNWRRHDSRSGACPPAGPAGTLSGWAERSRYGVFGFAGGFEALAGAFAGAAFTTWSAGISLPDAST